MPTFVFQESIATNGGTFLLPIPSISWFADSVMTALAEMAIPDNWYGDDEDFRTYAVNQASKMLANYKLLNFNPFPPGMIFPFGGIVAPEGYLICDGAAYAADDYPELFAQIGYYFGGSGDDFNVPSLINRVPVGTGDSYSIGDVGGEQTVTLTTAEIASHNHDDSGHSHSIPLITAVPTQEGIGISRNITVPILSDSTGTGYADIGNTGGDEPHENMPPFQAMLYIIYAGRENA